MTIEGVSPELDEVFGLVFPALTGRATNISVRST
jgi:hypothetical protein